MDDAGQVEAPPVGCGGRVNPRVSVPQGSGEGLGRPAEKSPSPFEALRPVPQTDTGGWVEQTKVRERNHVKELGKIAP